MLKKTATCKLDKITPLGDATHSIIKTAATKIGLDKDPKVKGIVDSEIKKHPTALFFKARAIVADEMNSNGDLFTKDELLRSFNTFVGVPFYTNHNNQDIENARGKIIHSEWNDSENAIYVIGFVDREAYPNICRGIEQDYMTGVSMGCSVEYSECSICNNRAATVEEYCNHIKFRKGRTFSGQAKDVKTGQVKSFKDAQVYERNYGIRFIELSGVGDPACKSCHIEGVFDNNDALRERAAAMREDIRLMKVASNVSPDVVTNLESALLRLEDAIRSSSCSEVSQPIIHKVSCVENGLRMYASSPMYKEAGKEEIDQLEQCLSTLEAISISLIQNRKQIETEFATDLVGILAELQQFTDELVGAGYGQFNPDGSAGAGIPGTEPMPGGDPMAGGGLMPGAPQPGQAPAQIASQDDSLGTATGVPGSPAVRRPTMPTPPARSIAEVVEDRIKRISERISQLERLAVVSGSRKEPGSVKEDDMRRRTPAVASNERETVKRGLEASLQENHNFSENMQINTGLTVSGGSEMSDNVRVAERQNTPERITEKQLDSGVKYNPRQNDEKNVTTQKQLDSERVGSESEVITEKQLRDKGKDTSSPDRTTERQLDGVRTGEEKDTITHNQLRNEGYTVDSEVEVITEKQLDSKPSDIWSRSAFTRTNLKTAEGHVNAVLKVLAESAINSSASPAEIRSIVSEMVRETKTRTNVLGSITASVTDADSKYKGGLIASRAKYWGQKGIVISAASSHDIRSRIETGLRILVANDDEIHPERVMHVLDVVSEDDEGTSEIARTIEDLLATDNAEVGAKSSDRDDIRAALRHSKKPLQAEAIAEAVITGAPDSTDSEPVGPPITEEQKRAFERVHMAKAIQPNRTHLIVASLDEVGVSKAELKHDQKTAKRKIVNFVKKACGKKVEVENHAKDAAGKVVITKSAAKLGKVAQVINVEFDGVNLHISAQIGDEKADLDIPASDVGPDMAPIEGDTTGENLDDMVNSTSGIPPTPPPAEAPLPTASSKNNMKRKAQFGGGTGGGVPGGALGGPGDPSDALPSNAPAMDEGIQTLTKGEGEDEEGLPSSGEQMMPGSICPICNSTDTETGMKGMEPGTFHCNGCNLDYQYHVNIEVLNPGDIQESDNSPDVGIKEPEGPAMPEMPVAASIKVTKDSLNKIAAIETEKGLVCAACGMTGCKPVEKTAGKVVYVCPACETKMDREIFVNKDDPADSHIRIAWSLDPRKIHTAGCDTCKKAARTFAAKVSVAKMMKIAATTEFPMANCVERINRKWGSNAVATYGECKGKPLAECACKALAQFGMRSVGQMMKVASVMATPDPMEECIQIYTKKKFNEAQAKVMCNTLRKKYAKEKDANEFIMAFADSKDFQIEELRVMKERWDEMIKREAQALDEFSDGTDIGAPLPEGGEEAIDENVTIQLPKDVAEDIQAQIEEASGDLSDAEVIDGAPEIGSAGEIQVASKTASKQKTASKPNVVKDIEGDVKAGIPRKNETLGNEGADNIDVSANDGPDIPRGDARMGQEDPPDAGLPDIADDSSYMGGEKEAQKGMPGLSNKMKGTVIAKGEKQTKKAAKPTVIKDIEKDVEAGIPRGKATIGNEGSDNIDVSVNDGPDIPRASARQGEEGSDNIDVEAGLPDIAVDSSYMGNEKETQKGMPPINHEMRGRVLADSKHQKQMERIESSRKLKAHSVLSRMMGEGRLAVASQQEFDELADNLSKIELGKIESFAEKMIARQPAKQQTLQAPIIQEASSYTDETRPRFKTERTATEVMSSWFTVGSKDLNEAINKASE